LTQQLRLLKTGLKRLPADAAQERLRALIVSMGISEESINDYAATHPKYRPMSWEEIKDAFRRGHLVGSHTMTHRSLARMPLEEARREIDGSLAMLRRCVPGLSWVPFAYPYGTWADVTPELCSLVEKVGYSCALTTLAGDNRPDVSLYALRRVEFDSSWFM
jgi:hypothetical protein